MVQDALGTHTKLQFSGHDTFPLRYGWLKKVFDAIQSRERQGEDTKIVFKPDDAIAQFGVGKNMVTAMRYWSLAAGIIEEVRTHVGPYATTPIGRALLDDNGWDPWLEDPNSLWLLHWQFASTPERTSTWYWVFNHCPQASFERNTIVEYLSRLCSRREMKRVAPNTLKRDVECFVRTYVEKTTAESKEDTLECPLTELSLLRTVGRRDMFHFSRGPKPTLNAGMFAYAATQFWQRHYPNVRTLSLDALFHEPGSPGRVFLLDEESAVEFAIELEAATERTITWSETAGLRQLICRKAVNEIDPTLFLSQAYGKSARAAA